MTKLTIKVTKDILERSKYCGHTDNDCMIGNSCAIALAIRDIFPNAFVNRSCILPYGNLIKYGIIKLPVEARAFIGMFDDLEGYPEKRLLLPELEFEVEIPDSIVEEINISEVTHILENHPTLKLTEA